jgi:hypothetical protein
MKLPKINKQTIQSFFLYHAEKLIILLALGLMGWFFWSGYKTEVFDETTPQQLKTMADQAGTYINADDSWNQIADSRMAVESLPIIINDEGIDASEFERRIPSVAVKSLAPRSDPELFPVTDLIATPFTSPIFLATSGRTKDPLEKLPFAAQADLEDEETERPRDRRRPQTRRPQRRTQDDEEEEIKIPGENVPLVQHHESVGLRPGATRLTRNDRTFLLDGVAVTGVVDVKKQYNNYQASFAFGAGYYPERDRPTYQYVQIERAKVVDGKPGDWEDISQRVHEGQTRLYPAAAPEVVAPENYDEILTGVIPPLTMVDYKPLSLHPKVSEREFPDLEEDGQGFDDEGGSSTRSRDLFSASTDDENQVERRVGPGISRRNSSGRGSRSGPRSRSLAQRRGSDKRPYEAMLEELEPTADHKLVRFFDLQTAPGATYQYRVRLWLADPNNEPDEETRRGGGRSSGRGGGGGSDGDFMEDAFMEEDFSGGGRSARGGASRGRSSGRGGRGGLAADEKPEKVYTKIPITPNMKSKESRARLARAREEQDPDDATRFIYYVAEAYGEGEGNDRYQEIKVPRRAEIDVDALFDLDELRFARPTKWSEPVTVTISKGARAEVAAGDVIPPKMDRVGSTEVPDGEPMIDMAVSVWSTVYKTLVPTKQQVRRGDLLSYVADSHLLNPLTWTIHEAEQQKIDTGMVMVDIVGGEEVDTGRTKELMPPSLPGEALVMSSDGQFEIHNDFEDQKMYRHSLFIHDDSAQVGEVKEPKRNPRERGGRFGFDR